MKKLIFLITILIVLALIFIPVNADELKEMNIKVTEYPERTVTISHTFDITARVPKSDYYNCLDVCFCDDMDVLECEEVCKIWCFNNYVK